MRWWVLVAGVGVSVMSGCGGSAQAGDLSGVSPSAVETVAEIESPRTFTVVATGDPLLHEWWWYQAERDAAITGNGSMDFGPAMSGTEAITSSADLAICHMETVLAPEEGPYFGWPNFSSPPQIVPALADMGYDSCSTASNHTFDQGAAGIDRTLGYLDAAGIAHAGAARSPEEAATPTILSVETENGPVQVAHLSYTYGFNGYDYPEGQTWRANLIDVEAILDEAERARAAGAEAVVLSIHWGDEFSQETNASQELLAQALTQSGDIDLIIGHHAHVVQPIQKVNGTWVAYGHGNKFACHESPWQPREEGLLTRFTLTEQPGGGFTANDAEYLPILATCSMDYPGGPHRVMNIPAALASGDYGIYGWDRLAFAADRTTTVVNSLGAAGDGLRPLSQ